MQKLKLSKAYKYKRALRSASSTCFPRCTFHFSRLRFSFRLLFFISLVLQLTFYVRLHTSRCVCCSCSCAVAHPMQFHALPPYSRYNLHYSPNPSFSCIVLLYSVVSLTSLVPSIPALCIFKSFYCVLYLGKVILVGTYKRDVKQFYKSILREQ